MSTARWQTTVEPGQADPAAEGAASARPLPGLLLVSAAGQPAFAPCPVTAEELKIGRAHAMLSGCPDSTLSRVHALVSFRDDAYQITDLGSRNGSFLNGQRFTGTVRAEPGAVLRLGHSLFLLQEDLCPLSRYGVRVQEQRVEGPALQGIIRSLGGIAQHSRTLFISGESGSGKEALAQAFHNLGPRPEGPFTIVNCATLPEGVAERLLFGAQKGAYTGATSASEGYVSAASGGTLFLDEIADLNLVVQAKLLRVIENGEVVPLGSTRPRRVDLRICSATHTDLRGLVSAGKFRADLYFRLGVPQIQIPPLRERREEIPWLLARAVQQVAPAVHPRVALIEQCLLREWPGNVRELLAEVHTAALAALAAGSTAVGVEHMSPAAGQPIATTPGPEGAREPASVPPELPAGERTVEALEDPHGTESLSRTQLLTILIECNGNLSAAARALSLHRTQLRRYLERFGIDPSRVRDMARVS
jgi:DNA-binding NtrC family response regulator